MTRRSTRSLIAWSLVGLIGGHQAAYLVVYRDPELIAGALDATGHGWLWVAPILVLSAALTALILGLQGGGPVRSIRWRFAFLAFVQVAAFLVVEIGERSVSGSGVRLTGDDQLVIAVGIIIQAGIALLLALASTVVERIAAALARHPSTSPRRRPGPVLRPGSLSLPGAVRPGCGCAPRAPPIPA